MAIVAALRLIGGSNRKNDGVEERVEDYVRRLTNKVAMIVMPISRYGAAAIGVFAIAKLAL